MQKFLFNILDRLQILYWDLRYSYYYKQYELHPSFRFNGRNISFYGEGQIIAGKNSYIGELSSIQAGNGNKVVIGENCQIGHNVRMYTNTDVPDQDFSIHPIKKYSNNIYIGDYTWIGVNVFINPGVRIGKNSIIGANSVITKDVPAFAILGGVPAKLIRMKNIK